MRTRYYSPVLRRFLNADVVDGSILDSTTLNLYTFVNGNPISYVDPFGLSAERGNNGSNTSTSLPFTLDGNLISYSSFGVSGSTIRNPWDELEYPGEIHNQVVEYLAIKHGLEKEYNKINKANRYDLFDEFTYEYWEVKPVSYISSPKRIESLNDQIERYEKDGVKKGHPLGRDSMTYMNYTIDIYGDEPGMVYYAFQREEQLEEVPVEVTVPDMLEERDAKKNNSINWEPIAVTACAVAGIALVACAAYFAPAVIPAVVSFFGGIGAQILTKVPA